MRPITFAVSVFAAACTFSTTDPTAAAKPRPERRNLLADAGTLHRATFVARAEGGWQLRVTTASAAPAGDARTGSDDFYLGSARREVAATLVAESPADGVPSPRGKAGFVGPSGPATGGPAASGPAPAPAAPAATLRAGSTDDNAQFADFLSFLDEARENAALKGRFVDIDVAGRCTLQVVDRDGVVMPGVPVTVVDEEGDEVVFRGTTYGDGRLPFYPALAGKEGSRTWLVEVPCGDRVVRHHWDGKGDTRVRLPIATKTEPLALDVAFVIDTTGSMGDEIAAIKATLLQVTARLRDLGREFDLRYGAVLYRDLGDAYVTAQHDFTGDIEAFDKLLADVEASGGGDGPESLNQGLAVAVDGMTWRTGAAKVAFLIADAPPHLDYANDIAYDQSLRAAVARGIRVHTVAASGLDKAGSVVFRQIAQFTRGEFVFLEYGGSLQASAAAHGVNAATGNNLDDILYTRIRDEIARWGRDGGDAVAASR